METKNNLYLKEYTLEYLQARTQQKVGHCILQSIGLRKWEEEFTAHSVYSLLMEILGQKKIQIYEVDVCIPKNWWEHFKLQCFPNWLEKRFPTKFRIIKREVSFNHWALFPESDLVPNQGKAVIFTEPPYLTDVVKKDEKDNEIPHKS